MCANYTEKHITMPRLCRPFLVFILVIINVDLILSEDIVKPEDAITKDASGRAIRDDFLKNDQWRAVEEHQIESGGWKAADDRRNNGGPETVIEGQPQKRRRLRKRKRRPQIVIDGETIYEGRPRRRRPVRLDENRDVWKEMETEDTLKRPNSRRRISPIYQPEAPVQQVQGTVSASLKFGSDSEENISYEKIRDPYIAFQEAEEKIRLKKLHQSTTTSAPTTVHDLKALLKQSGGRLNLSELLQQRNLSLSDLLKGKQQAISVLTESPEVKDVISEYRNPTQITSTHVKAVPNRIYETENDSTDAALLDDQRKRFSMIYANKENKIYGDVSKYDVVTEATTEKRIFVPSHPSIYTSLIYKPNPGELITVLPEAVKIITTTTEPAKVTISPQENIINKIPTKHEEIKLRKTNPKLPITSALLMKTVKKPQERYPKPQPTIPPNAIKIDISELLGLRDVANKNDDGPLKMTFNLEDLVVQQPVTKIEPTTTEDTNENIIITERVTISVTSSASTTKMQDKLQAVSAKDEIMEILKDEEAKDHLSKILELRNMTVEELVEQRERGSSQRHLADIFHNSTREPVPKEEHVGEIKFEHTQIKMGQTKIEHGKIKKELLGEIKKSIDPLEENFGREFERKAKSTSNFEDKPVIDIKNLLDVSEELITSERIPGTSFPTYKIETHEQEPVPRNIPIWKTIYPSIFNEPVLQTDTYQKEIQKIDEIEQTVAKAVNEDYEEIIHQNNNDYDDYVKLPIGVKSAIFASLAIIGMSLLVFLTILIIFKWTQKHKKRLGYSGSFACSSKIKSPILEIEQQKRSFRTLMHETLGRKKGYYKSHMQSMSDPWDNDGKPYQ